ncbi:MAG: PQQ-dependent sugar dehydrogenase [Balneolaceae bacterium]|nr:MAG: PQQ-dependent sugar dehydrogenase [Balneolaceae bacterium]
MTIKDILIYPLSVTLLTLIFFFSGWSTTAVAEASGSERDSFTSNSQYTDLRVTKVAGDLEHPWSVAFLPDGRMLVTERPGRLNIIDDGQVQRVDGLPEIHARGQGGLMEVVLHPEYESNGWIYLTWSKPDGEGQTATALGRARLDGHSLADFEELFVQDRYSSPGRHYGSRLAWTLDGKLLMSIGDRGTDPPRAQDLMDHAGTLLRFNDDGTVPGDNPFVGDDNAHDEIHSYGHRNIQGLIVHPETGQIWVTDHGPRGGDELNLVEAGKNYGWPVVTLGLNYRTQEEFPHAEARRMEGMVDPVYELLPTHAPSGLAIVTPGHFTSRWDYNQLAGGLRAERIRRLVVDDPDGFYEVIHDEELLLGELGRIRDVRIGPDNNIYILTDRRDGALWKVEPGS